MKRYEDGGDVSEAELSGDAPAPPSNSNLGGFADLSGISDALNGDLGMGGINLGDLGINLNTDQSGVSSDALSKFMDQVYGTASDGNQPFNLASIFNPPNQSDAETARLLAAANGAGASEKDPLTGLTTQEAKDQADRVAAFTQGLTNNGVQNFGTGAITDKNLQGMQDSYTNAYNNAGGFTSGYQTVGDNKIMVHDDGTATGINTVSGQTFTLPASAVDAMTASGVLNSASSGYNTVTGGNTVAPGGGKTIVLGDGSKVTTLPDGSKVTVDTNGKTTVTPPGGNVTTGGGTKTTTATNPTSPTKPADNSQSNILALLALMALMNQGGGGGGSAFQIPTFKAERGVIPGQINYTKAAGGGMMGSGIASLQGHLGGYSDGGRLLKGPGDGVSDDIPATIGGKEPARLADGEFVIPARIVSELGNGSTDAGARKLYAMMDRVKQTRSKAKDIAADTKADKHLPA